MDQKTCPYLGSFDAQYSQQPGIEYPSFENHCFADPNFVDNTLLLGDQATYCLFGGCRHCPRFQDAQRFSRPTSSTTSATSTFAHPSTEFEPSRPFASPTIPPPFQSSDSKTVNFGDSGSDNSSSGESRSGDFGPVQLDRAQVGRAQAGLNFGGLGLDSLSVDGGDYDDPDFDEDDEYFEEGRRFSPTWLLAGMMFLGIFLCSSVIFFSVSFQAVRGNLAGLFSPASQQGLIYSVDPSQPGTAAEQILQSQANGENPSILVVVTATPDPLLAGISENSSVADVDNDEGGDEESNSSAGADSIASDVGGEGDDREGDSRTEGSNNEGRSQDNDDAKPDAAKPNEQSKLAIIAPSPTINFPKAVTPTPIVIALDRPSNGEESADDNRADGAASTEQGANPRFIPAPTSTPVPEINVQVLVPTPPSRAPVPQSVAQVLPEQVSNVAAPPVQPAPVVNNPAVNNPAVNNPVANNPVANNMGASGDQATDQAEAESISPQDEAEAENAAEPTMTPLPTPTWPPPLVIFSAKDSALQAGECTEIRWTVENVRAIYVENMPMNGSGDREECIRDRDETFVLTVVLPDGGTRIYTTTVQLLLPTATPTPTSTFTPVPISTPTWTPIPPTPTPTPAFIYGVSLAASGSSVSCAAGSTCEIGITVTNIGNTTDNLAVFVERGGEWLPSLCRSDGVCSVDRLIVAGVGQGNSAPLTLKFDIPAGSLPRNESYLFRASSESSGGAARSEPITIDVKVE